MNTVAAKIYAFGMSRGGKMPEVEIVKAGELLGEAAAELNRQHELLADPFIRGWLEYRKSIADGEPQAGPQQPQNGVEKQP